jgi:hypothetical protein
MDDRELLAKYEPVLRFAKSERFFPMAVEPYLEKCHILPSGPQGVAGLLWHLNEKPGTWIGKLHSGEYYLRFVNDPLIDSDVWVWWEALSVIAAVVGKERCPDFVVGRSVTKSTLSYSKRVSSVQGYFVV